jgi:hypothetical protein
MLACRVLGHQIHFRADAQTLRWSCLRACGERGEKTYETAAEAQRFAAAFNTKDSDKVGHHPTFSTLPLWFVRKLRGR